jgi:hypothetical protein
MLSQVYWREKYNNYISEYSSILFLLGHYTTYALLEVCDGKDSAIQESEPSSGVRDKRWMHFSDERAVEVSEEEVLQSEAYMLFYDKAA